MWKQFDTPQLTKLDIINNICMHVYINYLRKYLKPLQLLFQADFPNWYNKSANSQKQTQIGWKIIPQRDDLERNE